MTCNVIPEIEGSLENKKPHPEKETEIRCKHPNTQQQQ
jgi:hypothetical protein